MRTDGWFTPPDILDRARIVLEGIELDPASCEEANEKVKAERLFTFKDDALEQEWDARSIWLNPPGGKTSNKSNTVLFWQKLRSSRFNHAMFMAFSLEALQTTQKPGYSSIGEFPLCIPSKRLAFYRPGWVKGKAPSHSNVVVYVPGITARTDVFVEQFKDVGVLLNC